MGHSIISDTTGGGGSALVSPNDTYGRGVFSKMSRYIFMPFFYSFRRRFRPILDLLDDKNNLSRHTGAGGGSAPVSPNDTRGRGGQK